MPSKHDKEQVSSFVLFDDTSRGLSKDIQCYVSYSLYACKSPDRNQATYKVLYQSRGPLDLNQGLYG